MRRSNTGFLLAILLCGSLLSAGLCAAAQLTLIVQDPQGQSLPARAHILDATAAPFPLVPDSLHFGHYGELFMKSYIYIDGQTTVTLPTGVTTIDVAHGFEWRPRRITVNLQNDTTIVVVLSRTYNMAARGIFCGDNHAHTRHAPSDYMINPDEAHFVERAEGLNILWALDDGYQFSGGPHPVSSTDAILYYATEWRHQVSGHVALLGLRSSLGTGCCLPGGSAVPLLSDLRGTWNPADDQAMSLCHPRTNADWFDDGGFPAWGMGRECAVMAALGALDVYDVLAFSNVGEVYLDDWYRLMNCGFRVPIGAGTDGRLNSFYARPLGSYRVYVKEPGGHNASDYVRSLRAGRSFVSNFPLIPEFTVDGADAGSTLTRTGPATVAVHFRVESSISVSTAQLIVNGVPAQTFPLQAGANGTAQSIDTQLNLSQSSWIAVRVDGTTNLPVAVTPNLFAHTGATYVQLDGLPLENTLAAGRFLDQIDSLATFANLRGAWPSEPERTNYFARLDQARIPYRAQFHVAPSAFSLLTPEHGDSIDGSVPIYLDWEDASDPEAGDRVTYRVVTSPDSLFLTGTSQVLSQTSEIYLTPGVLPPNRNYWWRVVALDRNNNSIVSTPNRRRFYLYLPTTATPLPAEPERSLQLLSVAPNPATTYVALHFAQPIPLGSRAEVLDLRGARLAANYLDDSDRGLRLVGGDRLVWDARDAFGRDVPSGCYFVRLVAPGAPAPLAGRVLVIR